MENNTSFKLDTLTETAKNLVDQFAGKNVIAFHGDMGAGKTTFIAALCKALGTDDVIGSPTFSIINQYQTKAGKTIYHMDWYRLKDEEEAIQAGVEDALYSGHLCLVEWPDRAPGLLPDDTLHLRLEWIDENTRKLLQL